MNSAINNQIHFARGRRISREAFFGQDRAVHYSGTSKMREAGESALTVIEQAVAMCADPASNLNHKVSLAASAGNELELSALRVTNVTPTGTELTEADFALAAVYNFRIEPQKIRRPKTSIIGRYAFHDTLFISHNRYPMVERHLVGETLIGKEPVFQVSNAYATLHEVELAIAAVHDALDNTVLRTA